MPYLGQSPSKGDENNFKILDDISSYTLTFDGSDASVVSAANDTITSLNHRFVQGQRVTYGKGSGGTAIAGLTDATVYYIIKHDHHNIKLATSASNATNGTAVNITGVAPGGSSHTLNVAFDGTNTKFKATHTNGQKAKITRSAQLVISINGVIQQPHDSATPSTGFGFDLDGTIVLSQAPVVGDVYWAHVLTNNNVTFDISDNDVDNFTGNGSTVSFNLSKTPPDNRNVLVTIDGVVQYPNDPDGTVRAYTVVDNVLTFTVAPAADVQIQVRHIGFAGSTSGGGGVTNFYGRTGSVVLKNTDNIVANNAEFAGNLTVQGTMTTLDTKVTEVDQLEVAANNTTVGVAITQSGTGDILNLYDGSSEVFSVTDGGITKLRKGLQIIPETNNLYSLDGALSYYSTTNAVYLNGAGASGWLRLNASGVSNDRTAINLYGQNYGGYGDQIRIKTASGERIKIGSDGKVGINTTDTGHLITVLAQSANSTIARFKAINKNSNFDIITDISSHGLARVRNNIGATKVELNSNGASYFTGGNVGIGTDAVTNTRLDVFEGTGTNSTKALVRFQKDHTSTFVTGATGAVDQYPHALILENQDNSADTGTVSLSFSKYSSGVQSQAIIAGIQESAGNMALTLNTESGNTMGERLRITSGGNVGIGSAIPAAKLDVVGSIRADGSVRIDNNASTTLYLTSTSTTGSSRIFFGDPDSDLVGRMVYAHDGDYFTFFAGYGERFRIAANGDLTATSIDPNAVGPTLKLFHNSASPAANDVVSRISMFGDDAAGNETEYGRIETVIDDTTNSQETAHMNFSPIGYSVTNTVFRIKRRGTGSAPSYTTDDADGIILDVYNTGDPYPRYMNFIAKASGNTASNIGFWTEAVGGSPTEKVRIDSDGRVLIGTNTYVHSQDVLTVYDTANALISVKSGGTGGSGSYAQIAFKVASEAVSWIWKGGASQSSVYGGAHAWNFYHGSNSPILFHTHNGSSVGERLRIDSSGRLQIGDGTYTSNVNTFKAAIKEQGTINAAILFLDTDNMRGGICGATRGNDELITGTGNMDFVVGSLYSDTHIIRGVSGNTNGAIGMTIEGATGHIGINNTNPTLELEMSFTSGTTQPTSGTTPKGIGLSFGNTDGHNGGIWFSGDVGGDQGIAGISGSRTSNYDTDLRFYTNNTNSARAFTERLRITSGGTVHTGMTGTAPTWLGNTMACREKFSVFQGANFGEACFNIDVDNSNTYLSHNMYYDGGWKIKKSGSPVRHLEIGTNGWRFMTGADGSDNTGSALTERLKIQANGRINIGEGNSGSPLAAVHINTNAAMGTDTALWVGDNANKRYMAIQQVSNSEQFSHIDLYFNDNGSRSMINLQNPYAPAGFGAAITWKGYNGGDQGYIECKSEGANSANGTMYLNTTNGTFLQGNSNRHVKMPQQPSFAVYRNQSSWPVSNGSRMEFNTARHNTGSHFDISSTVGRFTAPIAGSYQFNFYSIIRGNYTNGYLQLYVSGSRIYGGDIHFTISNNSSSWHNVSFSQVLYLSSDDYVELFSYTGSGSGSVDWHGNHWQCFSGWLLG